MSSACSAPACFMASKMDIMSRGWRQHIQRGGHFFHVGISCSVTMLDFASVTVVLVRGVTSVEPVC